MIRDPFYRQIIARLKEGGLDPELFEQCAADLLRAIYPTLVPIRGGADSGMDGAIADGKGEPFPLVSTTGKYVIGNLTRSLRSYLQDARKRRKVVLATSQKLSPKRIANLYERADELGFILVNVYTQEAMADLLYRSPKWCLELLNLTGDPPPLSAVPRTERPLFTHALVGREADLFWIRQNSGDRLLVGQPGSGKTFLLRKLVMEGEGLFVVSENHGEIAVALRAEQPEVLIVDDAQLYRELLKDLRHIRETTGAKFSILASCWPGDKGIIKQALNLPESRVHSLDLLTRDEIVEVIKATGIRGPNQLVRELVDQAEGRPGLAVTLAHLCLQGGVQEVTLGDALSRDVLKFFEPIVGQAASEILAAFSIGGDSGMPMKVVADGLGLKLIEVRNAVTKLAAGGVILDIDQHSLSVRPPALRHALVRDVFFKGAMSLPIERLLAQAPYLPHTARTLIGAKARGAAISQELLIRVLEQSHSEDAWKEYAWLGYSEATWTLKHHPEKIIKSAWPALHNVPELAIPLLLEAAIGDQRPLHSNPEHPLRLVDDWVSAGLPGTGEALRRRKLLFESLQDWLSSGADIEVGLRAFQSVLSPVFKYNVTDPGMGRTVTLRSGYLLIDELLAVQRLWDEALKIIVNVKITDWRSLCDLIEAWGYPGRLGIEIPSEMYNMMRCFTGRMLCDIIPLVKNCSGVLHWASQIAEHLDLEIKIPLDQDFDILYPKRRPEDWEAAEAKQMQAVRELAVKWSKLNPVQVVKRVALIEQEAESADIRWPRWTPFLCAEIAEKVLSPTAWIRAMIDAEVTGDLIGPFLRRAARIHDPGWIELAVACLGHPTFRGSVISLVLTLPDALDDLVTRVFSKMEGYAELVEILCLRNQIPEYLVGRLLRHEDETIASAAAQGEWYAEPEGTIRNSLHKDWRDVVLNRATDDHWLGRILKDNPRLAYDWLGTRLKEQNLVLFRYENALKTAVGALDVDSRLSILRQVPQAYDAAELVACLIDNDLDLYRVLLSDERLRQFHLVPLSGHPEGIWVEKAKLALDKGYSIEEIAHAVHAPYRYFSIRWNGNESDMWADWVERFDRLCSHEDERVRRIGELGKANAKASREEALKRERKEAVYGIR